MDSRTGIENGFLQELIEAAIHAGSGVFAWYIRRVFGTFINQRTTDGVEKMLYRLAEPVIFSSLQVNAIIDETLPPPLNLNVGFTCKHRVFIIRVLTNC